MSVEPRSHGSRIMRGSALLFASQATLMLVYFLAQRVVLSTLTKEENGVLFAERRIADLLVIFLVDFGLGAVILRKVVQEPERARTVLSTAAVFRVAVWIPAMLLCLAYASIIGYSSIEVFVWAGFLLIGSRSGLLRYVYEVNARAKMNYVVPVFTAILDSVLYLALIYIWRENLTPAKVIYAFGITAIPGFLIMALRDGTRLINPRYFSMVELRSIIRESAPLVLAMFLVHIHDKIDAFFLDYFSTSAEVGVFAAAYTSLSPLTATVPAALVVAFVPVIAGLAKTNWSECQRYTSIGIRFITALGVVACSVMSVLAPFFIDLVSSGRYADAVIHFTVFLWLPVPIFVIVYIQDLNVALSQQKRNVAIAATLAVVTFIGGVVFIPHFNSLGAVFVKLFSVGAAAIVAFISFRKTMMAAETSRFVLGSLASVAVCVSASVFLSNVLPMWPAAVVSGLVALSTIFLSRLIRISELASIRRLVLNKK